MNHYRHCRALRRLLREFTEAIILASILGAPFALYFYQMAP